MNDLKEIIINKLKKNRPNITDSSIKTYVSNLVSINKKLNGDHNMSFYDDYEPILKFIEKEDMSLQTKKTLLSALYIMTNIKEYREKMIAYCNEVNNKYKEQKLTDKQKEHRISFEDVKEKVEKALDNLKNNPTLENYKLYLASVFSSGIYSPPRRSEFCNVKIKNYDINTDNYLLKKKIIFNQYKTSKKYGSQTYDIPNEVLPFLKKYLKVNTSDYLFTKSDHSTVMNNSDYNRLLNKIFGKTISVDSLRSIYLSEKYKNVPNYNEMADTATKMGNSIPTSLINYVKKE
jgi:integrase